MSPVLQTTRKVRPSRLYAPQRVVLTTTPSTSPICAFRKVVSPHTILRMEGPVMRRIQVWATSNAPPAILELTIDAPRCPHLPGYKLHFVFHCLARDAGRQNEVCSQEDEDIAERLS